MTLGPFTPWNSGAAIPEVGREVDGCDECNRRVGDASKPWPVFTVTYNDAEVCAKCLTPIHLPRKRPA